MKVRRSDLSLGRDMKVEEQVEERGSVKGECRGEEGQSRHPSGVAGLVT